MDKLAILASHPVQYYAPLFRELSNHIDLHVFYAHNATKKQQAAAGFGTGFQWDIDLTSGYSNSFLKNIASVPNTSSFSGCDTPEIGACLQKGHFTSVLATGWHLKSMLQGIGAAKRQGLKVLVRGDSHLDTPRSLAKKAFKSLLYPVLLSIFDGCLYVGKRNKAYYKHYGVPDTRLFYSPHCVDTARFEAGATLDARASVRRRLGIGLGDPIVLFAGKLVPFKRPLDVLDALAKMRRNGLAISLLVAGSGPLEDEMRLRAKALGVPLHMLGFQNQTQMPAAYAASDVIALPSNGQETWGLVCNEALACGRGIVVSDQVGCAPDLATDGMVGRTFPMGDIDAFARCLGQSITTPAPYQAVRELSEKYSLKAAADGVLQSLRECANRDRRRNRTRA